MKKRLIVCISVISLSALSAFSSMAGWYQNGETWRYETENKECVANGWELIDGLWYYFDEHGNMAANIWIGNYYVGSTGAMLSDTITPDGYRVGADGLWIPEIKKTESYTEESIRDILNRHYSAEGIISLEKGVFEDGKYEYEGRSKVPGNPENATWLVYTLSVDCETGNVLEHNVLFDTVREYHISEIGG